MRWWDGLGWTEHVALPEAEAEDNVHYLAVAASAPPVVAVDDGLLHPRARNAVFAGSPRGPVPSVASRRRPGGDDLLGLVGLQLLGGAVFTLTSWWLAANGLVHGGGTSTGIFLAGGTLVPLVLVVFLQLRAQNGFWYHWCASRGFEPGPSEGTGCLLPGGLDRSPLMGPSAERVVEFVARRRLADREAVVGSLLRLTHAGAGADPRSAPVGLWRSSFVVMSIPEAVAASWPGASIRADHHARRPLQMRAMAGSLVPNAAPEGRSHLAAAADQDMTRLQVLVDPRLEQYLVERPMDVDIIGDLLVVMRDGAPSEDEQLDQLCRDALVLHELLVAPHELPAQVSPAAAATMPPADEPVVDLTREGWGEGAYVEGELADAA